MTTALATVRTPPDVMAVDMGFIGKFAEERRPRGSLKAPYNALQFRDKGGALHLPAGDERPGVMVGMPVDIGPRAQFYPGTCSTRPASARPT